MGEKSMILYEKHALAEHLFGHRTINVRRSMKEKFHIIWPNVYKFTDSVIYIIQN